MAKRPTSRSQADDTAAGAAPLRPRRARPTKAADIPGAPVQSDTQSARGAATGGEPMTVPEPSEQEIRTRAYLRYLERGGSHGNDFQDWLDAERELKGRQ